MQQIDVVGAAILDDTKVLAAQRSASMGSPFKWEFAGGKVEENETHQQALEREIREELGVRVAVGEFLAAGISEWNGKNYLLHIYEAKILEGVPVAKEHAQLNWVEIDGLGELDWADADIPACKELMRRYGAVCWNYRQ